MITEQQALELVKQKNLRMVCNKRARKLRKKGRHVRWMQILDCYVWFLTEYSIKP